MPHRSSFTAADIVSNIWTTLDLPPATLRSLHITGHELCVPSSFKIADLAQASIALSALLASQIHALRNSIPPPLVTVPRLHAVIEFKSERLYKLPPQSQPQSQSQFPSPDDPPIGGLYKSKDGYVRVHDSFPNQRSGARALLLGPSSPPASRAKLASQIATWRSLDLEDAAFNANIVIAALRSYPQWDTTPQAAAVPDFPIRLRRIGNAPAGLPREMMARSHDKSCLRGLRVLEFSRVIAAPCAGRTLAAHGADVLWVTSPLLPDLPALDRDLVRGKRTVQIDLETEEGRKEVDGLLDGAHVLLQGYRPGSLAARGLDAGTLAARCEDAGRGIICANMSAYGPDGPWRGNRGFDSLVQTCSGMNVSEAEHYGAGEPARPMPCQALDHAGGYFLAAGIQAALYRQATEGGSWEVDVSLAGVMKYLRSLGQFEGDSGFRVKDVERMEDVPKEYLETRETGFGTMTAVRHSASIEGVGVGWDVMPKPLGSDEKRWL